MRFVQTVRIAVLLTAGFVGKAAGAAEHVVELEDGSLHPPDGYAWVNAEDPHDFQIIPKNLAILENGKFRPADGYMWVDSDDPNDLRVVSTNVVKSDAGTLRPADGYMWAAPNSPRDFDVVPVPAAAPKNVVVTEDGKFRPEWDYKWVVPGDPNDLRVVPRNVVVSDGKLRPRAGYAWAEPDDPSDLSVVPVLLAVASAPPLNSESGAGTYRRWEPPCDRQRARAPEDAEAQGHGGLVLRVTGDDLSSADRLGRPGLMRPDRDGSSGSTSGQPSVGRAPASEAAPDYDLKRQGAERIEQQAQRAYLRREIEKAHDCSLWRSAS